MAAPTPTYIARYNYGTIHAARLDSTGVRHPLREEVDVFEAKNLGFLDDLTSQNAEKVICPACRTCLVTEGLLPADPG
jgi:hypothetical protein